MIDVDPFDLEINDDVFRELREAIDAKVLQLKHPYVLDLIKVLAGARSWPRGYVLDMVLRNRKEAGLPIPPKFEHTVQQTLEYHCRDSDVFKKRKVPDSEALFCWPNGKGAGKWALIHDNARAWVQAHRASLPRRILKI